MTPLMDREFYERLRALRQEMERGGVHPPNIAHVFVPVGPYAGAVPGLPRVLFVGQATRGYGGPEVADFDSAFERGAELVLSKSFPTGRTAFWRFARGVMRGVALGLKHPAADHDRRLAASVGWSNLAKVGDKKGNATPVSLAVQADLCVQALRSEIELMRPDAVVVATGGYAKARIFDHVFGAEGWSPAAYEERRVHLMRHAPTSAPIAVWTAHPGRLLRLGGAVFDDAISEVVAALSAAPPFQEQTCKQPRTAFGWRGGACDGGAVD